MTRWATSRTAPTTMTVVTCSGSEASTWSSSGSPSNLLGELVRAETARRATGEDYRGDASQPRMATRQGQDCCLRRLTAALLTGAVDTSGCLGVSWQHSR